MTGNTYVCEACGGQAKQVGAELICLGCVDLQRNCGCKKKENEDKRVEDEVVVNAIVVGMVAALMASIMTTILKTKKEVDTNDKA